MKKLQILLPSVYGYIALILMGLLHYLLPLMDVIDPPYSFFGFLLQIVGLALVIGCLFLHHNEKIPVMPFDKSPVLLTQGIYRYSRNPIYLGMLLVVAGTGIILGTLGPLLIIPVYFFILNEGYIKYEEAFLESLFGDDYRIYKSRVRRWL